MLSILRNKGQKTGYNNQNVKNKDRERITILITSIPDGCRERIYLLRKRLEMLISVKISGVQLNLGQQL
jgi:hypothetical protein